MSWKVWIFLCVSMLHRMEALSSSSSSSSLLHPSIAKILSCEQQQQSIAADSKWYRLDRELVEIQLLGAVGSEMNVEQLIPLARECETLIFDNTLFDDRNTSLSHHSHIQSLIRLSKIPNEPAAITVATLVALITLEDIICQTAGCTPSRAPILSKMLSQLYHHELVPLLKALLLPQGLNLRNLLWHGFIGDDLPASWLALICVLIQQLERKLQPTADDGNPPDRSALNGKEPLPVALIQLANEQAISMDQTLESSLIPSWLPSSSHRSMFRFAVRHCHTYPVLACAILTVSFEAALREDWCRANHRPDDRVARPMARYVTLDGHGQRQQHDLLMHPYLLLLPSQKGSGSTINCKNELLAKLGGGAVALVTDLYMSPLGPNLRARMAHGSWHDMLQEELLLPNMENDDNGESTTSAMLRDQESAPLKYFYLILLAMEQCACRNTTFPYCPMYSYSASTVSDLKSILVQLKRCNDLQQQEVQSTGLLLQESNPVGTIIPPVNPLEVLSVPMETLHHQVDLLLTSFPLYEHGHWTVDDAFQEFEINCVLAHCGAARTLLLEIRQGLEHCIDILEQALVVDFENGCKNKQAVQRKALRKLNTASSILTMHSFATMVAVHCLQSNIIAGLLLSDGTDSKTNQALLLKAVQRTRMILSTFTCFLFTNTDRSYRAVQEYAKSKVIRAVLEEWNASVSAETESHH